MATAAIHDGASIKGRMRKPCDEDRSYPVVEVAQPNDPRDPPSIDAYLSRALDGDALAEGTVSLLSSDRQSSAGHDHEVFESRISTSKCKGLPSDSNATTPTAGSCVRSRKGTSPSRDDGGGTCKHIAGQEIPGLHVCRDGV